MWGEMGAEKVPVAVREELVKGPQASPPPPPAEHESAKQPEQEAQCPTAAKPQAEKPQAEKGDSPIKDVRRQTPLCFAPNKEDAGAKRKAAEGADEESPTDAKSKREDKDKVKREFTGWSYKEASYDSILSWSEETRISYRPEAKRPGTKSRERYDKYSPARTVGEALALGSLPQDLLNDYEVGFITVVGGPFRARSLDKQLWDELSASGQLSEMDKKVRPFISKGGRYPIAGARPAKEEKGAATERRTNSGEDSAKRAKAEKPSAEKAPSSEKVTSVMQLFGTAPKAQGDKAAKPAPGSLMGFFKGEKAEPAKTQPATVLGFFKTDKADAEKSGKPQSGSLLSIFKGDKSSKAGDSPGDAREDGSAAAKRPADAGQTTPQPSEKKRHLEDETPAEKGGGMNFLARLTKMSKEVSKEPERCAKERAAKAAAAELERCAGAGALAAPAAGADDDDLAGEELPQEEEQHAWDAPRRKEAAAALWESLGDSKPGQDLEAGQRLPYTAVVEAFSQPGTSIAATAALLRPIFTSGSAEDLVGILDLLLVARSDHGEMTHSHIGHCIAMAYGLNSLEVRLMACKELPETAVAARKKQRTFYQGKKLAAADVGKALAAYRDGEGVKYSPWNGIPTIILEKISKVLVLSTEHEASSLIHIFQGRRHFHPHVVLRSLAHAAVLARSPAVKCPQERAELIVRLEEAVFQSFAQSNGRTGPAVASLLQGHLGQDVVRACPPILGTQVLHMRAESPKDIAMAVERISAGAVLCEWLYVGERAQVHVTDSGNAVEVFSKRNRWMTEKAVANEEAKSILTGCLNDTKNCILDVIFLRPKAKAEAAQQADDAAAEPGDSTKGSEGTKASEDRAVKGASKDDKSKGAEQDKVERVMVILDLLASNGRTLCQTPLRERRAELKKIIQPKGRVHFPHSEEVVVTSESSEEIASKLEASLSASNKAKASSDAAAKHDESLGLLRTLGIVLKSLDGETAHYWAGRAHCGWQAVRQQSVGGPEADRLLLEHLSAEAKKHIPDKHEFMFTVVSGRRTGTKEGIRDILTIQKHYTDSGVSPRWYVDVESLDAYRKLGLDAHAGGKLIPSRNMALDDAFKAGKVCVQTSDDISKWEYFVTDGFKCRDIVEANTRARLAENYQISPVAAAQFLLATMRSRDACKLGGVYCLSNSGRALSQDRFGDHQFIMGDFFVAEPSDIRFDTRLDLKEDYDYTASHLHKFGSVLRCNHLLIHAKHLTNAGGACSYRNAEREQRNIAILKEKWGTAVRDNPLRDNEIILCWGRRPKGLGGKK